MEILNFLKKNKFSIGFLQSFILSLLILIIIIIYKSNKVNIPLKNLYNLISYNPSIITFCAIFVIIINTILLSTLNYLQKYSSAKGVFLGTLVMGLLIFVFKMYFLFFQFN